MANNNGLSSFISRLPVVSGLRDCSFDDHREASYEFCSSLVFAFFPILIAALMELMDGTNFFRSIINNVKQGELFIYATTILSPFPYIAWRNRETRHEFPNRLSHGIIVLLIIVTSALSFARIRSNPDINSDFVWYGSIALLTTSLFLTYLATVYRNYMGGDPASKMKEGETSFSDDYRAHRESDEQ